MTHSLAYCSVTSTRVSSYCKNGTSLDRLIDEQMKQYRVLDTLPRSFDHTRYHRLDEVSPPLSSKVMQITIGAFMDDFFFLVIQTPC